MQKDLLCAEAIQQIESLNIAWVIPISEIKPSEPLIPNFIPNSLEDENNMVNFLATALLCPIHTFPLIPLNESEQDGNGIKFKCVECDRVWLISYL